MSGRFISCQVPEVCYPSESSTMHAPSRCTVQHTSQLVYSTFIIIKVKHGYIIIEFLHKNLAYKLWTFTGVTLIDWYN